MEHSLLKIVPPRSSRTLCSKMASEFHVPLEDERELLAKGIEPVATQTAPQPILGSYLPVNPVQRYTFKKWDPSDWNRHIASKRFQSNRDRDAARV